MHYNYDHYCHLLWIANQTVIHRLVVHNRPMNLDRTIAVLEQLAPLDLAEEWDNVGLLINPPTHPNAGKILLTIDLTEAVADEAIGKRCGLVLTYHPILFRPASRLDATNAHDRTIMKLIQNNIAVYSPHTALDAVAGGVNDWLTQGVGPGEISFLRPIRERNAGQGRLVVLDSATALEALIARIKQHLGIAGTRFAVAADRKEINTVAVCAGAGGDVFKGIAADCFLTGEMGHHQVLAATMAGTHVILCEHTNTERGYLPVFAEILRNALGNCVDISIAAMDADPIKFN